MLLKETGNEKMVRFRPLIFKSNTFRNLSLPYSTEIGIWIDLLHLNYNNNNNNNNNDSNNDNNNGLLAYPSEGWLFYATHLLQTS